MTHPSAACPTVTRLPDIVLSDATLARIDALVDGAALRNPALAQRLLEELGRARIVPARDMPANIVAIGSTVTYRDEAAGTERTVTLVFPEDADIARQKVSVMTPIGVALLGLPEGAAFYWDTRTDQRRTLTVIRVEPGAAARSATRP
jgi:regulator of nucleoside diphosphate kinase